MGKLLAFFLSAILLSNAHAIKTDGSIPINPESEITAVARAAALDPLGNSKPSKKIPDASFEGKTYKTISIEGGLQLHPSCELEARRKGITSEQLKLKVDSLMKTMLDRIVRCKGEHPEMKRYLSEAIAKYRRQNIRCEPAAEQQGLVKPDGTGYAAYYEDKGITVSNRWLDRISGLEGKLGEESALSTIFHELLHGTHCNNRHDHNDIESLPASAATSKACENNVSMDRVSVVQSLCMGTNLVSSTDPASLILATRMNMCGSDRGCRDMFTERGNSFTFFNNAFSSLTNEDISDSDATRLCQRIKDDGMCLHFRQTQGPAMTESNSKVKAVKMRMQDRFDQIMPKISNQLSTEYFDLVPGLSEKFNALKNNPCFKSHFYISPDKPNQINALRTKVTTIPSEAWFPRGINSHFNSISSDFTQFVDRMSPDNACADTNKDIKNVFNTLSKKMSDGSLYNLPYFIEANKAGDLPYFPELKDLNSGMSQLLGKDLVRDYMQTLDKLHYKSPNFDCVAAGLAPFRTMEAATQKPNACEQ